MTDPTGYLAARLRALPSRIREELPYAGRALLAAVLSFAGGIALLVAFVLSVVFVPLGVGVFLVPLVASGVRALANKERALAREWFSVEIPVPYRPVPGRPRCRQVLTDPATWRDLLWLALAPVGLLLGILPAALFAHGAEGVVLVPVLTASVPDYHYGVGWLVAGPPWLMAVLAVPQGLALTVVAVVAGRRILRLRAAFDQALLAPTGAARLALRVRDLASSRTEVVDARAAELRRIERDLHDGAQARLVALGMNLGMAEDLLSSNPEAVRALLAEARQASDQALAELRDLVRGIHPPVLAERGLEGALAALALTLPVPVTVDIVLAGRAEAPVETAAYFAGAEALANVVKHSGASRAWLRVRHDGGRLVLEVGDDGGGGADPRGGTGLRGVERRLRAHDGTLAVASPPGGPTVLTMEVPCALSSPRTSHC